MCGTVLSSLSLHFSIANGVTTSSGVNDSIIATTTGSPSIDAWASYAADTDQVLFDTTLHGLLNYFSLRP